jgi:hypothetical protein
MNRFGVAARVLGGIPGVATLVASSLVAAWFAIFGGLVFFIDSVDFFHYADRLRQLSMGSYFDTVGYPFLIVLTGFTRTGSVVPLLILQAIFAAIVPWLAFKTFEPFDRKAGAVAGAVCLASLTPYYFQNEFFHDGTCLFFGLLSIALASMFFHFHNARYIYLSISSATYAYLVQPAAIGFFVASWATFMLFSFFERSKAKHVLAASAIFAATAFGVSAFEKSAMRHYSLTQPPSQLGRQIFFNEYLRGARYAKFRGPAADDLRNALVDFFAKSPPYLHGYISGKLENKDGTYQRLFGRYKDQPHELVREMFDEPNLAYFEVMWNLPDLPDKVPDRLFLRASLEYLYSHPLVVARYVSRNVVDFAIGPPWICSGDKAFPECRYMQIPAFPTALSHQVVLARGRMPDKAYRFLTGRQASQGVLMKVAAGGWRWVYDNLRLPFVIAMLLGWVASFWNSSTSRWALGALVGAYGVSIALFSFLVDPQLRYQVLCFSICAFGAGAGAYFVLFCLIRAAALMRFRNANKNSEAGITTSVKTLSSRSCFGSASGVTDRCWFLLDSFLHLRKGSLNRSISLTQNQPDQASGKAQQGR